VTATALSLAAILALAGNPQCGAAEPGGEFAQRLAAIALHESGGSQFIIGVNADLVRRLPASVVRSDTAEEAAAKARALVGQGRSIDLGLMQINSAQLARHGLTIETVFDACRNMAAGADHYADDVRSVWTLAHRRYNTGTTERGQRYAAEVEQVLARVKRAHVEPSEEVAAAPARPRSDPVLEDALHASTIPNDSAPIEAKEQTP
jgi:type IV secretion system protein VirB1